MIFGFKEDKSKIILSSVAESGDYQDLTGTANTENVLLELDTTATSGTDKEIIDALDRLNWTTEVVSEGTLDSKELLLKQLNTINDTGWISLIPYIESGFSPRDTDLTSDLCPAYRIKNNIVYFKGFIYSTSAKDSKEAVLCSNIPTAIRVKERGAGSVRFKGTPYHVRAEGARIFVYDSDTIGIQQSFSGYGLACLSYPL